MVMASRSLRVESSEKLFALRNQMSSHCPGRESRIEMMAIGGGHEAKVRRVHRPTSSMFPILRRRNYHSVLWVWGLTWNGLLNL